MNEPDKPPRRRLPAAFAAVGVGVVVLTLWSIHPVGSWATVGLAALLALLIPVAPDLAGRILRVGAWLAGFSLVVWFIPWPDGVSRAGFVLALLLAALTWQVVARRGDGPKGLVSALLPRVPLPQGLVFGCLAPTALLVYRRFFTCTDPDLALQVLARAWDCASHFDMAEMMRRTSELLMRLPAAPDGTAYVFSDYPPSYPALAALVMDLVAPRGAPVTDDVAVYLHAFGLIMVGLAVTCAAAAISLLGDQAPAWLVTAVGLVVGMSFVTGPGASGLTTGFDNFGYAVAMVFVAWCGAARLRDLWDLDGLSLVLAGIVGAGCAWTPLGAVAGAGLIVALATGGLASPRGRPGSQVVGCVVAALVSAAVLLVVSLVMVRSIPVADLATIEGGVQRLPSATIVRTLAALVLALIGLIAHGRRAAPPSRGRLVGLTGLVVVCLLAWWGAGWAQYADLGQLRYYIAKLGNGLVMLGLPVAVAAIALWAAPWLVARPAARARWSLLAVPVALLAFGSPVPLPALSDDRPYPDAATLVKPGGDPQWRAALEAAQRLPLDQVVIVARQPSTLEVAEETMAASVMRLAYTYETIAVETAFLDGRVTTWEQLIAKIAPLVQSGRATLVVPPDQLDAVRQAVGADQAGAVVSW